MFFYSCQGTPTVYILDQQFALGCELNTLRSSAVVSSRGSVEFKSNVWTSQPLFRVTDSPIERPALVDDIIKGPHCLLNRRLRVRSVGEDDYKRGHRQLSNSAFTVFCFGEFQAPVPKPQDAR